MTISNNLADPMVITILTSFPFSDTKAIPWIYDSNVYIHGQRVQVEPAASVEPMVNITRGRNHNKALYISIECVDTILYRVLVDTDSSLNVLPKSSLSKLTIEGLVMKPSELVVREFDASRWTVIGEVDLPIKIRPYTFVITFFVMDIYPAYNFFSDGLGYTESELSRRHPTKG